MLPHRKLGLLVLLSVLLDSASACPLTLHPPVLVQQYGEPIVVNCTSTDEDHDGIYWSYGNETNQMRGTFTLLQIPSINWDTQAQCTIILNGTHKCNKDLQITVYKKPTNVTVLSNSPAIEGSVLELQCDIRDVAPIQNLTVTWYKNNKIINTDFTVTAATLGNVSSSLSWNLSREDDGAHFTCEALLDLGPHGPQPPVVSNDTWIVSLDYAPEFQDEHEHNININSSSAVLHCEAMGNPFPHFYWTKDEETVAENTEYLNITHVNVNSTYNCIASNYLGNITKKFNVNVMESAPKSPTAPEASSSADCPLTLTPDKIVVPYGGSASVNCSSLVADAKGIGWEASTGGTGLKEVSELIWTVKELKDWAITAACFITLKDGSQCEKALNITVYNAPGDVLVSSDGNGTMVEGTKHQLKCDICNVAPVEKLRVNWYQGNQRVHTEMFHDSDVTPKDVHSNLTVTLERKHNGANFTCEAELLLGPTSQNPVPPKMSAPYTAVVYYEPSIQDCPSVYFGKENEFKLSTVPCKANGNPEPVINWFREDTLVNASKPLTRRDSGHYTAKVENHFGNTKTAVDITIEYGPTFSCKDHYDIKEKSNLGSECEPEGIPKPNSVWFKDGIPMASPHLWKRHDSGEYLIMATNKHGTANYTLNIDVLYSPEFTAGNSTQEFTLGENVMLSCSAEGNPLPELQWNYPSAANVKNNTRGRQLYVNVTGATSTNAGVYSCSATNKVGSVTRTVTLILKEEPISNSKSNSKNIWLLLIFIIIILIIAAVILYRNRKKKHGHYRVISDNIPLSTRSSVE